MADVSPEEAWSVLLAAGYGHQFESHWKQIVTVPGKRLVGRAVTAVFTPLRPDINAVINEHGKVERRSQTGGQNSWVIDTLKPGDVLVVDLFGNAVLAAAPRTASTMTLSGACWNSRKVLWR
jgi:4-hydroxy-4-methyl-2-oxoglutarate aldolase